MHALALRLGDGPGKGEEGALAVGAGDMQHRRKLLFGMAERGKQPLDPAERQDRSIADAASSAAQAGYRSTRSGGGASLARRCAEIPSIPSCP